MVLVQGVIMRQSLGIVGVAMFIAYMGMIAGCSSPTESSPVVLDRASLADRIGDGDGTATDDELKSFDDYFAEHPQAWYLCALGSEWAGAGRLSKAQAKVLAEYANSQFFPNETDFRAAFEGVNIRTLYAGIAVIESRRDVRLVKIFSSPGSGIASAEWRSLVIE